MSTATHAAQHPPRSLHSTLDMRRRLAYAHLSHTARTRIGMRWERANTTTRGGRGLHAYVHH